MENFTPLSALLGGGLIGLAASLLLLVNGRLAGVSGIVDGVMTPTAGDALWRVAFLVGLPLGTLAVLAVAGEVPVEVEVSTSGLLIGGVITGLGVRFGSGCTSGHGICGLGRRSGRSVVATATFMASAFGTVFLVRHVVGG